MPWLELLSFLGSLCSWGLSFSGVWCMRGMQISCPSALRNSPSLSSIELPKGDPEGVNTHAHSERP
jgi:hypothetical protein